MDGHVALIHERSVRIGEELVGILTEPSAARSGPPLLLLNAGILHDVGPSRLYVQIARSLAAEGHLVLRFDFAGVGDSESRPDGLSFEASMVRQTRQVMDFLAQTRGLHHFVVGGICSGAVTALRVALEDDRVVGLALLNPQGFFSTSAPAIGALVRDSVEKDYLLRVSLRSRESWLRLLRGEVDLRKLLRTFAGRLPHKLALRRRESGEIRTLACGLDALLSRGVRMLQLYAAGDPGLVELSLLVKALPPQRRTDPNLQPILVRACDHLFTPAHGQIQVLSAMRDWLGAIERAPAENA